MANSPTHDEPRVLEPTRNNAPFDRHAPVATDIFQASVECWRRALADVPGSLQLRTDRPRSSTRSYVLEAASITLSPALTKGLQDLAVSQGTSLFSVLLSGWALLLGRWAAQEALLIGACVVPRVDAQNTAATLVTVAPLAIHVPPALTLAQLLAQVSAQLAQADRQPGLPLQVLNEMIERTHGEGAGLQALMSWQETNVATPAVSQDRLELSLTVRHRDAGLGATLEYASDLFERATVERMLAAFEVLLTAMAAGAEQAIHALPILTVAERTRVLRDFNEALAIDPKPPLVHELFEERVRQTPAAIAIECDGQKITYAQLNARANQWAHYLRRHGAGPDQRVAICLERSIELIVGLLGILKAGAAYVPLDPSYPAERLAYMVRDSAPVAVLTRAGLAHLLPSVATTVLEIEAVASDIDDELQANVPSSHLGVVPDHLVYVIYTSGSTGTPKGVMVEHRSVAHLLAWHRVRFELREGKRASMLAAVGFDASAWEIWGSLCAGATLVVANPALMSDLRELLRWWADQALDISFLPTPVAELAFSLNITPPTLKVLLIGGDRLRRRVPSTHFAVVNKYGPTETTVIVTSGVVHASDTVLHIGRPLTNTQVYILDPRHSPLPVGVPGEIFIGGVAVARGYLNRPEATAERFITDPFIDVPGARMYRTGDIGCWREDGTIEILGRNDDQIKIRGFRIELGEIEAQLTKLDAVKEAVVVAREELPGDKRLVAYVTERAPGALDISTACTHLQTVLPEYMVPSAVVILPDLPLTANGKVDRRRLPAPQPQDYANRHYEAPRGEREAILAQTWEQVLRVGRVGRQDRFFQLGGHSLLVVQMMERLHRQGLSLDVPSIYENATLAQLAEKLTLETHASMPVPANRIAADCTTITPQMLTLVQLDQEEIDRIVRCVPGGAANIQDIYPLGPLQQGIFFHHTLVESGGDTYVLPMLLSLSSKATLDAFVQALQHVIDRHDVLRTAVLWEQLSQPVQVVYRRASLPVTHIELNGEGETIEQLKDFMRPELQRMDLRRAPLLSLQVTADPASTRWYALLKFHHVIADHESIELMLTEVKAFVEGEFESLPAAAPYRDHVAQALAYAQAHDGEAFFRRKLSSIEEPSAPFGIFDVHRGGSGIERAFEMFEPTLSMRVRQQARERGVSPATLFHAAWALVVAGTSGQDPVTFGTVLLGRLQGRAGGQRTLGMFINTLPLALRLEGVSAEQLVEQTQRELTELLQHEQASLSVAQRCSGIAGSTPLFSTLFNYLHSAIDIETGQPFIAPGIQVLSTQEWTNYPITLSVYDQGEGFGLMIKADRRIDAQRILRYVLTAMQSLVAALSRAPETPASTLSVLPESERRQVVESFNDTTVEFPRGTLIHELFEAQVMRTPHALAVLCEDGSLTFWELNARANQLAHYLKDRGVGPDRLVGLCFERSVEMVVSWLGVLKAGGAYVPLDPDYPAERLAHILGEAGPQVILTHRRLGRLLPPTTASIVELDSGWSTIAQSARDNLSRNGLSPSNLAYVIYTSGSTGQPKGVMIEHRNLVSLWQGLEHIYRQSALCARIGVNASFNFDASVKQFVQLLSGRALVLIPQHIRADAARLLRFIEEHHIDGIDCTPSQLRSWIAAGLLHPRAHALHVVLVGGEPIDGPLWASLARTPTIDFYNVYGPTESTVDATFAALKNDTSEPHIGRPMENRRIYILDRHRQPLPIGVAGEMYIGGAGVARGYLHRFDLTRERFLADPFSTEVGARMYKTGDLARWRSDGALQYLGRNDHQVKIRGFRIELGDIEAQLLQSPHVKAAAVVAHEDATGDQRLIAYVVPDAADPTMLHAHRSDEAGADRLIHWLRKSVKERLPHYMLPSAWMVLKQMPLTPSGKLDRRALPLPQGRPQDIGDYIAPRSDLERTLADIWAQVLRVDRIGLLDSFFELGGHSLLAMQVVARIRSSLSLDVPVRLLFECPTLRQLAERVEELRHASLVEEIEDSDSDIQALLEMVAQMPEREAQDMVRDLRMRTRT